jgi:peptidoglycan lytic transglycosylase
MRLTIWWMALLLLLGSAAARADAPRAETGLASFYPGIGKSGEMTCAHRSHTFGKRLRVSHGNVSIECRVNDRGPFIRGRIIDVSTSAARALGMMAAGVVKVTVEEVGATVKAGADAVKAGLDEVRQIKAEDLKADAMAAKRSDTAEPASDGALP